ncbi:WD repeat-containing protein 11 [Linum perenne]
MVKSSHFFIWINKPEKLPIEFFTNRLVTVGNLEAAVSLLLSTPPESSFFYSNALRAVALSSAVSKSLLELAVKVVAANMVRTDRSLSGTHLLCAVGRHQEACSQLQDAGCWTDAATLAATHLKGSDYARVLQRWASHVLHTEHNIWRALILYIAAGALPEALAALREAQQPDTAAMLILACREIHAEILSSSSDEACSSGKDTPTPSTNLPGLDPENEDVLVVGEYFGHRGGPSSASATRRLDNRLEPINTIAGCSNYPRLDNRSTDRDRWTRIDHLSPSLPPTSASTSRRPELPRHLAIDQAGSRIFFHQRPSSGTTPPEGYIQRRR